MVLSRCGKIERALDPGLAFGNDSDSTYFGVLVVYGFFFITMVQIIAIVLGDKNTVLVIFCHFLQSLDHCKHREKPVFLTGISAMRTGFPVTKTGFSL